MSLVLQSYTGVILNWQSSINNGITWQTISNSNDSIIKHDANITQDKLYRASVQNGVCPIAFSDSVKVSVAPLSIGGVTSSSATVCASINSNSIR